MGPRGIGNGKVGKGREESRRGLHTQHPGPGPGVTSVTADDEGSCDPPGESVTILPCDLEPGRCTPVITP